MAAYFRSSVHDRVCSVVSTVQARQSDHRAKWQDAWIGRNDAFADSRPCRRGFACAIRGDRKGHGLRKLNAGRLSQPVSCATLSDNQCANRDACCESRPNHCADRPPFHGLRSALYCRRLSERAGCARTVVFVPRAASLCAAVSARPMARERPASDHAGCGSPRAPGQSTRSRFSRSNACWLERHNEPETRRRRRPS